MNKNPKKERKKSDMNLFIMMFSYKWVQSCNGAYLVGLMLW